MDNTAHADTTNGSPGHEVRDVNIRALVIFGIGLATLTIVALVVMRLAFGLFKVEEIKTEPQASPLTESRRLPPGPRLQVEPEQDLQQLRAVESEKLNSYGWVNKEAGVVHIPIERAMELVIERGLLVRPEGAMQGQGDAATRRATDQGLTETPNSGQVLERKQ
jgi:hypothetical protein